MNKIRGWLSSAIKLCGECIDYLEQEYCPECESSEIGVDPNEITAVCSALPYATHRGAMTVCKNKKCKKCGKVF